MTTAGKETSKTPHAVNNATHAGQHAQQGGFYFFKIPKHRGNARQQRPEKHKAAARKKPTRIVKIIFRRLKNHKKFSARHRSHDDNEENIMDLFVCQIIAHLALAV